jgi:hypothetical protein
LTSQRFEQGFVKEMLGHGNLGYQFLASLMKYILGYFVPAEVTVAYFQRHGFTTPLLVKEKTGLGLTVPSEDFSINDVRMCVGECQFSFFSFPSFAPVEFLLLL